MATITPGVRTPDAQSSEIRARWGLVATSAILMGMSSGVWYSGSVFFVALVQRGAGRPPELPLRPPFLGTALGVHGKNERACWDLVRELAGRGQVELLSAGFYEPVLSIIPEEDRIGQVRMMNELLAENFGQKPRGLWLTERVWEPGLPKSLAAAGIEFTLLDEEHFHYAGVRDLATTYVTEDEGRSLRVFPIDKTLRYYIPFHALEDLEAYLGTVRDAGGTAILGDDGEMFGE